MALVLVKEDGSGKSDANSYASAADADAYHDGHLYASAWTAASSTNKEKALVMATRLIDASYQFHGTRATDGQALQWPRTDCPDPDSDGATLASDAVPRAVLEAACEMARELLIADRTGAPPGEGLIAEWTEVSGKKYAKFDARPTVSHFAQSLLRKLGSLERERSGAARLVRT